MKAFSFNQGKNSTNITDVTSIFNSAEKNLDIIKSNFGTSNPTQINRLLQQQEAEPQEKAYLHFAGKVLGYKAQPDQDTFIRKNPNPKQ